jgi:hypothetical protein
MKLITLAQANDHLRLDLRSDGNSPPDYSGDPLAPEVVRKIEEATDVVLHYIASYIARVQPEWDETSVPPGIRAATLMVLAWLWEHRGDDETDQGAADGYLTRPVTSLLHRYRDPALA